ncbi:SAP30-binding protein [Linum perenne]
MASRKKQSEGIALLSMYSDEDDEEMEELGDGDAEMQRREQEQPEGSGGDNYESNHMEEDSANDAMATENYGDGGEQNDVTRHVQQVQVSFTSSSSSMRVGGVVRSKRSVKGSFTIVDYGHDEVAMSPEPEEGEIGKIFVLIQNAVQEHRSPGTSQALGTSQPIDPLEPPQSEDLSNSISESEDVKVDESTDLPEGKADPLDQFLPPPPKDKCPSELQNRISKFISLKKVGRSFNAEVRNRKDYRNPDFLLHAVRYQDIDQIGTCFSKDVFDPHGYDKSDFYDEIEADLRRDRERREQELKRSPKVEFVAGGTQPGMVVPPSKFSMPIPVAASGLPPAPVSTEAGSRDGRQNKKSKWDKVDGDGRNPLPASGQDSLATAAAAHAALLSATNAGAGYPAFVQQKRREAEERRSGDRKTDRRS